MRIPKTEITVLLMTTLLLIDTSVAGRPAARVGDMHTCPRVTTFVPHVGGPLIAPVVTSVRICGQPAANTATQATCIGPPDRVLHGSSTVFIGGRPAARQGDATIHGGRIANGCATVLIGP